MRKANLNKYKAVPTFVAPGPAFDAKAKAGGKTIFVIPASSQIPFVSTIANNITRIGKLANVKTTVWQNQGQPSQWVQGMNAAIAQKASAIVLLAGNDPASLQPQIKAAKAKGIRRRASFAVEYCSDLAGRDTGWRLGLDGKQRGLARLAGLTVRIGELHDRLWAEATRSVLLILQGLDAAGKDGTLKHVLTGLNPQGCRVVAFKEPTTTELAHDYLWRVHAACPARGELGVFNRSHYEDVAAARVRGLAPRHAWRRRYRQIREFERLLTEEGTTVVKVFLHVSQGGAGPAAAGTARQPGQVVEVPPRDLADRARWDDYIAAYEDAISATSTKWAPWYVVPADHNWARNLAVAELLAHTLEALDPQLPPPEPGLSELEIV